MCKIIVDGLENVQKGVNGVYSNDLIQSGNIIYLPVNNSYIITSEVVSEFNNYLPISLKIKGVSGTSTVNLSNFPNVIKEIEVD